MLLLTACDRPDSITPDSTETAVLESSPEGLIQDAYAWNIKTLVTAYERAGNTDPAWDEPAKRALKAFARARARVTTPGEPWVEVVTTNCAAAVEAGCDDPLLGYLHTRFCLTRTNSAATFADAFIKSAKGLQLSSYPSIRKFYGNMRAADQMHHAWGTNRLAETQELYRLAITNLSDALQNPSMPLSEVEDSCYQAGDVFRKDKELRQSFYEHIELVLYSKWPNASAGWYLRGRTEIALAWKARGSGYANTVTEAGWQGFHDHLQKALDALETAWQLNPSEPRIPTKMLKVELGLPEDRERMESWFNRAMALDANCLDACRAKLYYLEPKWHGSRQEQLRFGRECISSSNWAGDVPLILIDVHESISGDIEESQQKAYWKQSQVWEDIRRSFDRFFELNPTATNYLHDYASYAYRCARYDVFNELLPKLGPINHAFFGGEAEFEKMVAHAKEAAAIPTSEGAN